MGNISKKRFLRVIEQNKIQRTYDHDCMNIEIDMLSSGLDASIKMKYFALLCLVQSVKKYVGYKSNMAIAKNVKGSWHQPKPVNCKSIVTHKDN